jgi:hypothetical protein
MVTKEQEIGAYAWCSLSVVNKNASHTDGLTIQNRAVVGTVRWRKYREGEILRDPMRLN